MTQVKIAYASVLKPTNKLLKPAEKRMSRENAEITMNIAATNHGAHPLFAKRL